MSSSAQSVDGPSASTFHWDEIFEKGWRDYSLDKLITFLDKMKHWIDLMKEDTPDAYLLESYLEDLAEDVAIEVRMKNVLRDRRKQAQRVEGRKSYRVKSVAKARYLEMLNEQGGVCAICGSPPNTKKALAIDHCHATGRIRGLLCSKCNFGIAYFHDNILFLEAAKGYLAKYQAGG